MHMLRCICILDDEYGMTMTAELERRISEALLQDDRIESVDSFEYDYSKKGVVLVTFQVHTLFGTFDEEKVVNY